jgi:hypothetical protein
MPKDSKHPSNNTTLAHASQHDHCIPAYTSSHATRQLLRSKGELH